MPRGKLTDAIDRDASRRDPVEFTAQLLRGPSGDTVVPYPIQEAMPCDIARVTGCQWGPRQQPSQEAVHPG